MNSGIDHTNSLTTQAHLNKIFYINEYAYANKCNHLIKQSKGTLRGEGQARHQLLAKQKELIELQQKKIELELEQAKVQLVSAVTVFCFPPADKELS